MNYYLDTEFLEGKQDKQFLGIKYGETKPTIDLISIGIVAEDGRQYYAISKDFNLKEAWNRNDLDPNHKRNYKQKDNYWIRENVLRPIFYELVSKYALLEDKAIQLRSTSGYNPPYKFDYKTLKKLISLFGKTNQEIAEEIKSFCEKTKFEENEDGRYIIGTDISNATKKGNIVWDKPNFYAYYADYDWVVFCQLFGNMMNLPQGFPMYCIDLKQIYDQTKYEVSEDIEMWGKELKKHPNYPKQTNEHNALADAEWNQKLHKFLNNI